MEPSRAGLHETSRDVNRIVAVGSFTIEIALAQADDATPSQVDRRQDLEPA